MKTLLKSLLALTVATAALSAQAALINATFAGAVSSQSGTGINVGSPISGAFVYETALSRFLSFTIDGQSVAPGYTSSANITPDQFSAIYQAQVSPVLGGTLNSTFTVDLEGINQWTGFDPWALLLNPAQLAANLDTTLSTFGFYIANADGTNVRELTASLASIHATSQVPEPASISLLAIGVVALGLRRRGQNRV
jgi:hypothetical protein